jgi:hypothetical protein
VLSTLRCASWTLLFALARHEQKMTALHWLKGFCSGLYSSPKSLGCTAFLSGAISIRPVRIAGNEPTALIRGNTKATGFPAHRTNFQSTNLRAGPLRRGSVTCIGSRCCNRELCILTSRTL